MEQRVLPTADDIRAELARRRLPIYMLAAMVGLHPIRLSKVLNGRVVLKPELAERIMRAIEAV
jgi:plasmid maintenance system antidote protein VapI